MSTTLEQRKARQEELTEAARFKRENKDMARVFRDAKIHQYNEYEKTHTNEVDLERKYFELFASDDSELLTHFDNNDRYGPLLDITRLQRWERAKNLQLNPPLEIKLIMDKNPDAANKKVTA